MDDQTIITKTHSQKNLNRDIDLNGLENDLKRSIKGEVHFESSYRALYATDASNYRMEPLGVVLPKDREDIINAVATARKYNAPILSRGGGTSLAGQCTNTAVVLDFSKYYKGIIEFAPENKTVRVLPGTVLDNIQVEVRKKGLTLGPDPSTHDHCTIGGMVGNNSCGVHSVMAVNNGKGARTSDSIHSMKIMTYDGEIMEVGATTEKEFTEVVKQGGRKGEIYSQLKAIRDQYADEIRKRYPDIPRRVSGYNLDDLLPEKHGNIARALCGTEGTCVIVLEMTLDLIPYPPKRGLLILGYPDVYTAGHHVPSILKLQPTGLEGIDHKLIHFMHLRGIGEKDIHLLPKGNSWLLVEFGGDTQEEVDEKLKKAKKQIENDDSEEIQPTIQIFDQEHQQAEVWHVRESGLGATAFVKGMDDTWSGWEDSAVPPEKIGDYLKDLRNLFHKHNYEASMYGHFGQGLVHCRINFDLVTEAGLKNYYEFVAEATSLVKQYGGSYSGEHGDGQSRAEFLEKMYGKKIINAFLEFKHTWDPDNKMNPGKVIDPNSILSHLRLGTDYYPSEGNTAYSYPEDQGRFSRAVLRCVGVGKCRRSGGGTMCPSYMVTHEEMHSTRGRTHLLFELTTGKTIKNGWKDETIKESLDLCFSCKGCKSDCPVNVDVATYKSEFLSHYYKNKIRPLRAYLFGYISWMAGIASQMPVIANWVMHAPGISKIMKKIAGIAEQRDMPAFANETFKHWFFHSAKNNPPTNKKVIFWADTFNNYFHTQVAKSAVNVLIAAGWHVIVPKVHLCCGRPLYDYGMVETAKRWLRKIIDNLREDIRNGVPIVGIEPSCMATFKDELINLFPNDEDALRLSQQSYLFANFFKEKNPDFAYPNVNQKAIVHGHCHEKAIFKMDSELDLLKKMNVDYELLDSGCCGMAGAFGFEKDKYDVSTKAGERVLLPAVRQAKKQKLVLANGFSCKEQIRQLDGTTALHIAQLMDQALQNK